MPNTNNPRKGAQLTTLQNMTTYLSFKNDKKANAFAQAWAKKAKAGNITKVTKKGLITLVITQVDFILISWIKDNYKN